MLTIEKLQRKPKHFQAFTGVSVVQFEEILSGRDEPPQIGGGKHIKTLKKLLEAHPEIKEVWVDTTEQPNQGPNEKLAHKQYYSGQQRILIYIVLSRL